MGEVMTAEMLRARWPEATLVRDHGTYWSLALPTAENPWGTCYVWKAGVEMTDVELLTERARQREEGASRG